MQGAHNLTHYALLQSPTAHHTVSYGTTKQMESKAYLAIEILEVHGHSVRSYVHEGKLWFEIDGILHTSEDETENLSDRLQFLLNSYNGEKAQFNN